MPVLEATGARKPQSRTVYGSSYEILCYRLAIVGLFARIKRWTATDTGIRHWRRISRKNVTTLYVYDATSSAAGPSDPRKVFFWHICWSSDDQGNLAVCDYAAEDSAGIDKTQAHVANRIPKSRGVPIYLKRIRYRIIHTYFPDWSAPAEVPLPTDWHNVVDSGLEEWSARLDRRMNRPSPLAALGPLRYS